MSEIDIKSFYQKGHVIAYSRAGRFKLIQKDYAGSRNDYLKSISYGGFISPMWKLRSAVGYLLSLFKLDVEFLAKILNKKSYK